MSEGDGKIICRQCRKSIDLSRDNCPHCGTGIRSGRGGIGAVVIGVAIMVPTIISGEVLFFLIGAIIAAVGGYAIYDRRERIKDAETDPASGSNPEPASTE